jgi:hypothetical protein
VPACTKRKRGFSFVQGINVHEYKARLYLPAPLFGLHGASWPRRWIAATAKEWRALGRSIVLRRPNSTSAAQEGMLSLWLPCSK